jgi:hypothetical protein
LYAEKKAKNKYFERNAETGEGGNWNASGGETDSGQEVETSQAQKAAVGFDSRVIFELLRVVEN